MFELQLGYLPFTHTPHFRHQHQTKVIWKIQPPQPPWGASFLPLGRISKSLPLLVQSSINITSLMWQIIPEGTISKGLFTCLPLSLISAILSCCPSMHASQIDEDAWHEILLGFMLFTMFWSAWTYFTFKCSSRLCRSSSAPSFLHDCTTSVAFVSFNFLKFILYKLPLRSPMAISFPSGPLTIHSIMLIALSTHLTKPCLSRTNFLAT